MRPSLPSPRELLRRPLAADVRGFAVLAGVEAVVRGTVLAVFPLLMYRAWGDAAVNAAVGNAYANTRLTHEAAWLRPRHKGYMAFQEEGSHIVLEAITGRIPHAAALDALDQRFIESFPE